jgi:hypothetical protein
VQHHQHLRPHSLSSCKRSTWGCSSLKCSAAAGAWIHDALQPADEPHVHRHDSSQVCCYMHYTAATQQQLSRTKQVKPSRNKQSHHRSQTIKPRTQLATPRRASTQQRMRPTHTSQQPAANPAGCSACATTHQTMRKVHSDMQRICTSSHRQHMQRAATAAELCFC